MLQKDYYAAVDDYNHGILSGIVKIASKMGISTIQSYQGAKIFEAIGLKEEFINRYFDNPDDTMKEFLAASVLRRLHRIILQDILRHLIHLDWK